MQPPPQKKKLKKLKIDYSNNSYENNSHTCKGKQSIKIRSWLAAGGQMTSGTSVLPPVCPGPSGKAA
jgi:hypothetical protein